MYIISYENEGKEKVHPENITNQDAAYEVARQLSESDNNTNIVVELHPLTSEDETYLITYEQDGEIKHHPYLVGRDDLSATMHCIETVEGVSGISMVEFGKSRRLKDTLGNINAWFNAATPNPTAKNISTQIGYTFEEVHELAEQISLNPAIEVINDDGETSEDILKKTQEYLKKFADLCKKNEIAFVAPINRIEALDAINDIIVTATGIGNYEDMDVVGGQREVNRSNFSKFDENGIPIRDENQKIIKGPNYSKADLRPFV